MNIEVKVKGLNELRAGILDPKKIEAAARGALKKVADQTRTQAIKIIREEYNLPASIIRNKIQILPDRATGRLRVIISGKGRGIPLYQFGARQEGLRIQPVKGQKGVKTLRLKGTRRHGGDVTVLVKKGGGRKPLKEIPKPFITRMKSGHIGVFKRADVSTKRLPIKQLYGPGVGLLFGSVSNRLTEFANQKFPALLKHELQWRLSK